jgi:hypothetical protein
VAWLENESELFIKSFRPLFRSIAWD